MIKSFVTALWALLPAWCTPQGHIPAAQVREALGQWTHVLHAEHRAAQWLGDSGAMISAARELSVGSRQFVPYVQRLCVPEGSIVFFHGDLHGNVHALTDGIAYLVDQGYMDNTDTLKIKDPRVYMIFLGDYTDRGQYGIETLYTLARLKVANPDRVYMVRGNHEDLAINARYGLVAQLRATYPQECTDMVTDIGTLYDALPVALYVGIGSEDPHDYILCCHGGWEFGYDPAPLLHAPAYITHHGFTRLERDSTYHRLPSDIQQYLQVHISAYAYMFNGTLYAPTSPVTLGFMWDDFIPDDGTCCVAFDAGRGLRWGKPLLDAVRTCDGAARVRAIFRGHQHGDPTLFAQMLAGSGVAKLWQPAHAHDHVPTALWDGMVCTFLVAPDTGYGNTFDAWGELRVGPTFVQSELIMHTSTGSR